MKAIWAQLARLRRSSLRLHLGRAGSLPIHYTEADYGLTLDVDEIGRAHV